MRLAQVDGIHATVCAVSEQFENELEGGTASRLGGDVDATEGGRALAEDRAADIILGNGGHRARENSLHERLDSPFAAARGVYRDALVAARGLRDGLQGPDAGQWDPPREREALCGGDADPQPGVAPRPADHDDAVQRAVASADFVDGGEEQAGVVLVRVALERCFNAAVHGQRECEGG